VRDQTNTRTAAEALVDQLLLNGVRHAFCVPGESYLAVLDAVVDRDIALTVCRQEGGAAMMAEAVGKATGRPGICFVTRGPGAPHAAPGGHIPAQDSTPGVPLPPPGGALDARPRSVPGNGLPGGLRLGRQMGHRDRRSGPHSRARLTRVL